MHFKMFILFAVLLLLILNLFTFFVIITAICWAVLAVNLCLGLDAE